MCNSALFFSDPAVAVTDNKELAGEAFTPAMYPDLSALKH